MGEPSRDHRIITIGNAGEVSSTSFISTKSCIFKIPNILFRHNEKAYLPNAFSIGPLHHGQPHLKATEKIKSQYLHGLLSRKPTPHTNLKDLTKAIEEMEGDARDCYAVPTDYSAKDFVNMLVLDGCFIIELLRKHAMAEKDKNDPVFSMACMLQFLNHDLILLENQIPWFVLDRLFVLTSEQPTNNQSQLTNLAIDFFSSNFSMTSIPIVDTNHGSKHILDLLRNTFVLSSTHNKGQLYGKWELIPSATSLKEAGIKFKKGESSNILNISFKDGVLEIPPLLIQETTNVAFRNLISFEQCYPNCTANITSYAILLDNLINTTKDISILQEEGIIVNWLNPQDTVEFFNKLYHDTYVKEFYYLGLCKKVNAYCKRCWPRARAAYLHNHFGDPWAIVSQVVGGTILLLTFLQTIYAMRGK